MPERGEIWQVNFGVTQKVRPALVIGIPYGDDDRALIGVIPHRTATRGSQFEVVLPLRFLSEGAFRSGVRMTWKSQDQARIVGQGSGCLSLAW